MKELIRNFKQISILILAITFIGCEEDDAVLPQVVAGFTYTLNIDTGTVTFLNISENADKNEWDFGDEETSTLINPVKTFPNGNYTIVLEASNVAGESDTFEDEITILIPEIATLPITFDGGNTDYDAEVFGGASFDIVDNPDPSGTNTSVSKVGAVTNIGATFEGFFFDLGSDIDLTTEKSISMNFWADAAVDVTIKLEEGTGAAIDATASHGGTGWETIIFNFSSSDKYSRLTMFVDGPGTTAGTFYLDDIMQIETPVTCTAETLQSLAGADLNLTFMSDPTSSIIEDGAHFEWIDNPDFENDVNTSCKVGKITKLGNNPWDNNQIDLDAKLDFNANTGLKIKVWSARENTEVRIKLEEIGVPTNNFESFLTTSVTSGWEELTFPFSSAESDRFDKIVIFFDLNANNTDTYYFDDLMLYGTGSGGGGGGGAFDDGLLTNGDFEAGVSPWIGNAANVLTEGGNSFNFANVETAGNAFDVNLSQVVEITQGSTYELSFNASSDRSRTILAGIGLNEDPWTNTTQTVNLTTETQPFTLEFTATDFGAVNSRVIFDMGADVGVVVIDNVSLFCIDCEGGTGSGDSGLATNGDFETGDTSGWTTFVDAAGASFTASNAEAACGTFSGNLISDFESGSGGAVDAVVKQANIGIGTVTPNTQVTISFDILGSVGDGGVFFAEFFSELSGGGVSSAEILGGGPLNVTDTWTHYSFTTTTGSDVSGGITLQMKTSCGPVAGCLVDVYFDNVFVGLGTTGGEDCSGGGGSGGGGTGDELAINGDFETGDTSGWATFVDAAGASFTASSAQPSGGTYSGNLVADFAAGSGGAVDAVVKQANIGAGGGVTPNTEYVISFDLRGSAGVGGAFFAEFFSELSGGGVSSAEIITGGPHPLTNSWTSYSYTVITGSDVSGGITLQLKSSCGPIENCLVDVFFDNVSIKLK